MNSGIHFLWVTIRHCHYLCCYSESPSSDHSALLQMGFGVFSARILFYAFLGTTLCFRLIFYFLCPSSRINLFSSKP